VGKRWDFQLNLDNLSDKRYILQVVTPGLVSASQGFSARFSKNSVSDNTSPLRQQGRRVQSPSLSSLARRAGMEKIPDGPPPLRRNRS
jgi:hypothetical protein